VLTRVGGHGRDAATYNAYSDFNGREAHAAPGGADRVGVDVAEDVDCTVNAQDGEDGAAYVC
jgi:hypothetical protein